MSPQRAELGQLSATYRSHDADFCPTATPHAKSKNTSRQNAVKLLQLSRANTPLYSCIERSLINSKIVNGLQGSESCSCGTVQRTGRRKISSLLLLRYIDRALARVSPAAALERLAGRAHAAPADKAHEQGHHTPRRRAREPPQSRRNGGLAGRGGEVASLGAPRVERMRPPTPRSLAPAAR